MHERPKPLIPKALRPVLYGVIFGAVLIAGIGFAGSYDAVSDLAREKGFGRFALVFPLGIDLGIFVLLALDLLLSWVRIPFPLLRHVAWLLTTATIAFNAASAWPDPLGIGMHGTIPILFVIVVEAARHAIARLAEVEADRHMDRVRLSRWLLAPTSTFKLWRRMVLWELRSYEQAVGQEQDRVIYRARLRAKYGRGWRRKAPVEAVLPLRLTRLGVALAPEAGSRNPGANTAGLHREQVDAAAKPTGNTALTVTANTGSPAIANGPEATANTGVRDEVPAALADHEQPPEPITNTSVFAPRTEPEGDREQRAEDIANTTANTPDPLAGLGSEAAEEHREPVVVPAAQPVRGIVTATLPDPETDREQEPEPTANNEPEVTANDAQDREQDTTNDEPETTNDEPETTANSKPDRHAAARADRERLAAAYLATDPSPAYREFGEEHGVSAATVSKALKEWREREAQNA
ncbi:DUF2637 domain-containing protein [Streptomyces sp. NPDC058892]|uniref:DUF2637 domain-containing protein n=1 Tax=unclassified Streptomyces TaxID=2593676 RepID=UPI00368F63CF